MIFLPSNAGCMHQVWSLSYSESYFVSARAGPIVAARPSIYRRTAFPSSPSQLARIIPVMDGRDHEAVEDIERGIALPRTRIESGRRHRNKIKIGNDEDALPAEANRGYPGNFLVSGKRATKPPLITIEEQTTKIADCLKTRDY